MEERGANESAPTPSARQGAHRLGAGEATLNPRQVTSVCGMGLEKEGSVNQSQEGTLSIPAAPESGKGIWEAPSPA
jgi:hypothetical protein